MPREQRVELNKGSPIEVEAGTFKSKPSGSVSMPYVVPKKSPGQALAEGIGMASKALAKVGQASADEKGKQLAITQRYTGISEGKSEATRIIKELDDKKTPLAKYAEKLALALGSANAKLGEGDSVSASYLEGYLSTLGTYLGAKQDSVQKSIDIDVLENKRKNTRQGMKEDVFVNGMSGVDALKSIQLALNLGNDDAAKWYISNMSALINQKSDEDVNFDGQAAVDKYLKIIPEKGIVFADHPVYRDLIETLEAKLLSGKGSALKQQELLAKKITKDVTSKAMELVLSPGSGPKQLLEAEALVSEASQYMSGRERGNFVKLLRDLKQSGFASTSDPAILFKAKQAATAGKISFTEILALHTDLTADDVGKVYQAKIDRNKNSESKRGTAFNSNLSALSSSARSVLNVMSGPDKYLDPVSGANRVQMFTDEFMLAVENYKLENNTLVVPYPELHKMRDAAQKKAQDTYPMNALLSVNNSTNTSNTVEPGKGTAQNPIKNEEEEEDLGLIDKISDWLSSPSEDDK